MARVQSIQQELEIEESKKYSAGKEKKKVGMRIVFSEEKIIGATDALEIIFPNRKTQTAARIFIEWLKAKDGQASKSAVSIFADEIQSGRLYNKGIPFKYSKRNFYMTVLRTLISMGFIRRNVPVWDERRGATHYVYQRNLFDIPLKPPGVGFWRIAYYVCRRWNEDFKQSIAEEVNTPTRSMVAAQRIKRQPLQR